MPCVNTPCKHLQPKSMEQRTEHAKEFIGAFRPPFPVLMDSFVDSWQDPFLRTFSAWPERFYVFQYKKPVVGKDLVGAWFLRWWNMPSHVEGHRIDDIREWLSANVSRPVDVPPPLLRTTSEALQEKSRLDKVKEVFSAFDSEKRGVISREKMEDIFESLGYLPETSSGVFREVDIDRSGEINLEEFEAFFRTVHPRLQQELMKQGQLPHVADPVTPKKFVASAV